MSPKCAPKIRAGSTKGFTPKAFTLVELLVVIGIIAILIALVVTVIPRIRRAAYGAATSAQLSAISNAIQQYYSDFKAYPGPLANNQLGIAYDSSGTQSSLPNAGGFPLTGINGISFSSQKHFTGAQNLLLGLLGGLELQTNNGVISAFVYNPLDIFPDGKHPGPVGASTLTTNLNNIRRQQSYIQVKDSEISLPSMTFNNGSGASFADSAGRSPTDAPIPVFLDKFPDPLPILYIRTNVGGGAIVGVRNTDGNGNTLVDTFLQSQGVTNTPTLSPQYDLCQVLDYTLGMTGTVAPWVGKFGTINTSRTPYHGLEALGNQNLNPNGGTIDTIASGYANKGANGVAYFRDPNFVANANGSYDPNASNTHAGVAREKNGFLLITAGPDRAYGTTDDIIFPGTLLVAQ
jgi:prepilin-type N-terminal cleavage/methylation domain-containing protein